MRKFMSTSPRTQAQEKRMVELPTGIYFAVQKALENVWFGEPLAIDRACDEVRRSTDHEVYDDRVREEIANYINLLVRVLIFDPEPPNLTLIIEGEKRYLMHAIMQGRVELEALRQEREELRKVLSPLQQEVWELDRKIKEFRERRKEHDRKKDRYEQRLKELEELEQQFAQDQQTLPDKQQPEDIDQRDRKESRVESE
jgi:predicted  nucleic acid-binding Zn-ribbon protein